jgi:hypothetical protein
LPLELVSHVAVVEPIVQVFGKKAGDPEEFALEVDACDFQGGHFADAKAADCGNDKHHLEGIGRNVDDSRGGVSVEEKDLRLGFFVSGKHDVPLFDARDRVAPFSAQVQDRAEGAVDILRGFPPIHAQADCGHERLVLAEAQFTQRNLAKLWKNVCANVRQGRTRSP